MRIIIALALLSLCLSEVIPHVGPVDSHAPLNYRIQLQDNPKTRWAPVIRDYNASLHRFIKFLDLLPIPETFYHGVEWYAKNAFKHQDFVAEVDAVSTLSNLPFEKIFFMNFMYEYSTFKACTAILVRTAEGKILHGRNLDFEMYELIAKLLVNVDYYRGDQKVYSIDTVVGSVFALTGIRHGAFAANCDTRKAKDFSKDLISILIDNAMPTLWLLRRTLEEETSYAAANKRLRTEETGGPVYFIISGLGQNQGMVIEKDTNSVNAFYELTEQNWFIIQTNYDRDQPDPVHDPRRIPVEKRLRERGNEHFTEQTLLDEFMFKWPTFNIASIMTSVMVPSSGYHNTTVWYGENPKKQ